MPLPEKPEHKVDVVLLAEIHHFWAAVVTIATQGGSGSRPVPADAAYEPAQMASDLLTRRRLAGAKQHRQRPAGRDVVDMDGQKAALVVMGIEQRQLLMAVPLRRACHRYRASLRRCVARAIKIDHHTDEPDDLAPSSWLADDCRRADCSSPLSLTTYFFTEISFAAMIASLASRWRRKRITKSFRIG